MPIFIAAEGGGRAAETAGWFPERSEREFPAQNLDGVTENIAADAGKFPQVDIAGTADRQRRRVVERHGDLITSLRRQKTAVLGRHAQHRSAEDAQ